MAGRDRAPFRRLLLAAASGLLLAGLSACAGPGHAASGGGDGSITQPDPALSVSSSEIAPAVSAQPSNAAFRVSRVVADSAGIRVVGRASVFEGGLVLQVLDASGRILAAAPVQATAGAPAWADFQSAIALAPAARAAANTIRLFEPSPKDGTPQHVLDVPLQGAAPGAKAASNAAFRVAVVATDANGISVRGQASVFEGDLVVEVVDAHGTPLATVRTRASAGAPAWGDFQTDLPLGATVLSGATGIRLFAASARDGTPQHTLDVPLPGAPQPGAAATNEAFQVSGAAADGSGVHVAGQASVFEGSFVIEVRAADGRLLATNPIQASAGAPAWGAFQANVPLAPADASAAATVRLFEASAKDGTPQHTLDIPLPGSTAA